MLHPICNIVIMNNVLYTIDVLFIFVVNKLTCKCMNMSVWCGESGQVLHYCMGEEPYVIYCT